MTEEITLAKLREALQECWGKKLAAEAEHTGQGQTAEAQEAKNTAQAGQRKIRQPFSFVEVLPTVDSTNTYAKALLKTQKIERGLIVALEQTAGRGRQGKSFSSVRGNGIYMTLIFSMHKKAEDCLFLTSAAAVAVARALEQCSSEQPRIKWVNDVWIGEKKVCGILTEAVAERTSPAGFVDYAVVGIGINIDADLQKMPEAVQEVAGAVHGLHAAPAELAAEIAVELASLLPRLHEEALLEEYRRRSMIIGRDVYWETAGVRYEGRAADIQKDGNLVVDTASGRMVLNSGLVSIRPLEKEAAEHAAG